MVIKVALAIPACAASVAFAIWCLKTAFRKPPVR